MSRDPPQMHVVCCVIDVEYLGASTFVSEQLVLMNESYSCYPMYAFCPLCRVTQHRHLRAGKY